MCISFRFSSCKFFKFKSQKCSIHFINKFLCPRLLLRQQSVCRIVLFWFVLLFKLLLLFKVAFLLLLFNFFFFISMRTNKIACPYLIVFCFSLRLILCRSVGKCTVFRGIARAWLGGVLKLNTMCSEWGLKDDND